MKRLLALVLVFSIVLFTAFADAPASDPVKGVESGSGYQTNSDFRIQETGAAAVDEVDGNEKSVSLKDVERVLEMYYLSQSTELPDIGRPRVALVLSGGGAKGIAHIPIIAALESYGIPIDKVYGTSMGALIGGLYCAGISPGDLAEVVKNTDLMSLFTSFDSTGYKEVLDAFDYHSNNVLSVSLGQGIGGVSGIIDDYQVLNFFTKYVGNVPKDIDFEKDLVVPFECNAANMLTGDEVIFTKGNLITAMRASMSLPVIFEPVVTEDNQVLMDGGIVSNYIVHRAIIEGYDIIIVVTLDGYHKKQMTADRYKSLSGVMGSTLSIVLSNVSKGEIELADYWFSPDLTDYNTLSFGDAEAILQKGYEEVVQQEAKFKEIAGFFTEEQKVYKDPNRVSEYHTKYKEIPKQEYFSSSESRHEDFMGRTRISLGIYGTGGYGFYFKPSEDDHTRRVLFPTLSLRGFIKDLNGTPLSLDIRLKSTLRRTSDLSAAALYRFTEDKGERVFGIGRVRGSVGSLSAYTDTNEPASIRFVEGRVAAEIGVMLTNETDHQIQAYFTADNTWGVMNVEQSKTGERPYQFVPSFTVSGVYYPGYSSGFFGEEGSRFDVIGTIGYNSLQDKIMYKIALAAESTFKLSDAVSVWVDATAFSSKGLPSLRSTFEQYGGWNGMPGYSSDIMFADFIYGGIGAQFNLSKGFASSYIAVNVRGGVRSDFQYGLDRLLSEDQEKADFDSWVPFKDCFTSKKWDLGISVGYGLKTPIGDVIFGLGFNKNMQLAIYFELT